MDPLGPIDANRMKNVDPDQWMKDMEARIVDLKEKSADLADNLAAATATVTSNDGAVTVTIAPTGALQNLELGHRAAGMSPAQLTASIMDAVRKGQRTASGRMVEAFTPLGAGTESLNLVMSYLPPGEDDEEESSEPEFYAVDDEEDEPPAPPATAQPYPSQPHPSSAPAQQPFVSPPARPVRPVRSQPDHEEEDNEPW